MPTPLLAPVTTHSLPAMLPAECAAAAMGVVHCAARVTASEMPLNLFRHQRGAGVIATSAADGSVRPSNQRNLNLPRLATHTLYSSLDRSTRARRRSGRRDPPSPATAPATLSYRRGVISHFLGPRPRPYTFWVQPILCPSSCPSFAVRMLSRETTNTSGRVDDGDAGEGPRAAAEGGALLQCHPQHILEQSLVYTLQVDLGRAMKFGAISARRGSRRTLRQRY